MQKKYNLTLGLKLPIEPMLRLLEKIVQLHIHQDSPTSKNMFNSYRANCVLEFNKICHSKFLAK